MKKLEEKNSLCVRKQCPHRQKMQEDGFGMLVCCELAQSGELKAAGMPAPMIHAPFGDRCKLKPDLAAA